MWTEDEKRIKWVDCGFPNEKSNDWIKQTTYCIFTYFSYAAQSTISVLVLDVFLYIMHLYQFICYIVVTSDFSQHLFSNIENYSTCSTKKCWWWFEKKNMYNVYTWNVYGVCIPWWDASNKMRINNIPIEIFHNSRKTVQYLTCKLKNTFFRSVEYLKSASFSYSNLQLSAKEFFLLRKSVKIN